MPKKHTRQETDNHKHKGEAVNQKNLPPAKTKKLTSFAVELLVDEKGQAKRTKVMRVDKSILGQAKVGMEDAWDGWQERRLLDFFITNAELCPPSTKTELPTTASAEGRRESKMTPDAVAAHTTTAAPVPSSDQPIEPRPALIGKAALTGRPSLMEMETFPADSKASSWILEESQPFDVRLTLDFNELEHLKKKDLNYKATLYAKNLQSHLRQLVKEEPGSLAPTEKATISIGGLQLKAGSYQLQAAVSLTSQPEHRRYPILQSNEKLLEVY